MATVLPSDLGALGLWSRLGHPTLTLSRGAGEGLNTRQSSQCPCSAFRPDQEPSKEAEPVETAEPEVRWAG
jgi:hypothetical protein